MRTPQQLQGLSNHGSAEARIPVHTRIIGQISARWRPDPGRHSCTIIELEPTAIECRPSGRTHQCTRDLVVTLASPHSIESTSPAALFPWLLFQPPTSSSLRKRASSHVRAQFDTGSSLIHLLLGDIAARERSSQMRRPWMHTRRYLTTATLRRNTYRPGTLL
jgi:hypothetical protein